MLATFNCVKPLSSAFGAIDREVDLGLIEELVNAKIDGARNSAQLAEQVDREHPVRLDIRAGNLNVDGRRQSEVENLADHVGGQEDRR